MCLQVHVPGLARLISGVLACLIDLRWSCCKDQNLGDKPYKHRRRNEVFYSNRSAALMALARHREALADGRKAVELRPAWPKGYARVGAAFFALEQFTEVRLCAPFVHLTYFASTEIARDAPRLAQGLRVGAVHQGASMIFALKRYLYRSKFEGLRRLICCEGHSQAGAVHRGVAALR